MNCGYATLNEAFNVNDSSEDNSLTFDITTSGGKMFGLVTIECPSTRKKLTKFTWEAFPSSSSKKHLKKLKGTISDTDVNSFLFPINNTIDTTDYFVYVTPFFSEFTSTEQFPERKHHPYHPASLPNDEVVPSSEKEGDVIYSIFYTQQMLNKKKVAESEYTAVSTKQNSRGKNANHQLRAEPINPTRLVSPWLQSTISPDFATNPEIKHQAPLAYDRYMDSSFGTPFSPVDPVDTGIGISKESLYKMVQEMIPDEEKEFGECVVPKARGDSGYTRFDPKVQYNEYTDVCIGNPLSYVSDLGTEMSLKNVPLNPPQNPPQNPSQNSTSYGSIYNDKVETLAELESRNRMSLDQSDKLFQAYVEQFRPFVEHEQFQPYIKNDTINEKSKENDIYQEFIHSVSVGQEEWKSCVDKETKSIVSLIKDICSNLKTTDNKLVFDILEHITENKVFKDICESIEHSKRNNQTNPQTNDNNGLTDEEGEESREAEIIDINLVSGSESENSSPKN